MDITKACAGALLLFASFSTVSPNNARADDRGDWKLVSERKDIRVFRKNDEFSNMKTVRGVREITLENPYSVFAVFNDYPALPSWMHLVNEVDEISRTSDTQRAIRVVAHLPWPLKDREILLDASFVQPSENYDIEIRLKSNTDLLPPDDSTVRMPEFYGLFGFRFLDAHRIEVTYEVNGDPGGYIPQFLVNLMLIDSARITLRRLQQVAEREKYRNVRYSYLQIPTENVISSNKPTGNPE